jgi:hypothetical protein
MCNTFISAKISKFGRKCSDTGRLAFFGTSRWSMQLTSRQSDKSPITLALMWKSLTRYGNVFLPLFSLRIRKEQHHLPVVATPQDAQILADAFLPATLGFGFGHAGNKDQLGGEQELLEPDTI